jgi:hypothetical protein
MEKLQQYNTFQESHLGFKGIIAGVAEELIPDGYVPDMENLKISVEGIAEAVISPATIAPPSGEGGTGKELKSIFVWKQDSGTNVLLAQYGPNLYRRDGDHWHEILNATAHAFGTSTKKASYAAGMMDELYVVNEDTQCMKITNAFVMTTLLNGPKGKYITLWKNRLFIGAVTAFYGLVTDAQVTAGTSGSVQTIPFGALSSAVIWSNIGLENQVVGVADAHHDAGWYTGSIVVLRTPENSACTGLLPVSENLLMFTESAIFSFSGYSESNFSSFDYYHGANTPKDNAVVVAGGVFFIGDDGFYTLDKEPKKISDAVGQLIAPSDTLVSCAYFDNRVWFCTGHTLVAINVGTGAWEKYQYGTTNVETQDIVYAADNLYLGMGTTGNILKLNLQNTTPGYKSWYLETPVLNQGITSGDKRYKTMFIYAKNTSATIRTSYSLNYGAYDSISGDVVGVELGDKWGTMLWGNDLTVAHTPAQEATASAGHWSGSSAEMEIYKRSVIADLARTIKFRFEGSGEAALLGYAIVYKPKRKSGVR